MTDFFAYEQFYVAVSRATNPDKLYILLRDDANNKVTNVVYDEVLDHLK